MSTYHLKRRYFKTGTYSTLEKAGAEICKVVECPWLNNVPGKSCVPEGAYTIKPHVSPSKGECYILVAETLGVGESGTLRTDCLIHIANAPSELKGCMAPGTDFGYVKNQWAVTCSTTAFKALMKELNGEEHTLIIGKA